MRPLIAIDESSPSKAVIDALLPLRVPKGTEVSLLTVLQISPPLASGMGRWEVIREYMTAQRLRAKEMLEEAAKPLRDAGVEVRIIVGEGHAADKILIAAADAKSDLIVVGSHGRNVLERLVLGSVSRRVVTHAPCSVLIARASDDSEPKIEGAPFKILATFDGSDASLRSLEKTAQIEWQEVPDVTLLYVYDAIELNAIATQHALVVQQQEEEAQRSLEQAAELFATRGIDVSTMFRIAHSPHEEILAAAEQIGADLIVVGDKGHSAVHRFLIGSVTHRVANEAKCSVLVSRP